jgi:hypothetical protein
MDVMLPESVRIGPATFSVVCDTTLQDGLDGKIEYAERRIRIRPGYHDEHTWSVFMHEIMHGMLELACPYYQVAPDREALVEVLSLGLQQLLLDNAAITRHYLSR